MAQDPVTLVAALRNTLEDTEDTSLPARDCVLQIQKVIDQMDLGTFRYPFHFTPEVAEPQVAVRVKFEAPDLVTGKPLTIVETFTVTPKVMSDAAIVTMLRRMILLLLEHEVDENLHFKGVKFTDPHGLPPAPRDL